MACVTPPRQVLLATLGAFATQTQESASPPCNIAAAQPPARAATKILLLLPLPAAAGDAATAAPSLGRRSLQGLPTSAEVIVVGAGMAGMAAAQALVSKLGAKSVIVLEGRTRVGGRWVHDNWRQAAACCMVPVMCIAAGRLGRWHMHAVHIPFID